ncbi:hypothetical protein [Crassaminicella profunda]|uniref:hypothetical protein n=1 Tax=Crassaminicella profunda TaxID=1286698 RepID=UPI001CA75DA9|nr:hypothetical protein [Crassaminicella profunda]QZY56664.1 hypothetical protein K7H06_07015 [Crassaminicella profunda]
MSGIELFGIIAGVASIIGLFIGGTVIKRKLKDDNSVKRNKQIIKGGSFNQQAGRDIKNVK